MYAKMSEILTGRSADRTLEAAQGLADTDGSAGCDLADRNRLRIMSVNIRKHGFHPFAVAKRSGGGAGRCGRIVGDQCIEHMGHLFAYQKLVSIVLGHVNLPGSFK